MRKYWAGFNRDTRCILLVCFFAFFFNGLQTLMMGSILPDMKVSYGLTDTQAGLMLSGHSAGNLAACFLSGLVPLWLGRRKSIVLLSALAATGFTMMLVSGNLIWLVAAFAFTGMGRGSVSNFNNATVNRVTDGSPTASNLLHSFFAVGAISAPLVFLLFSRIAGWRAAVGAIILLGVLVSLSFSRVRLKNDRPDRADRAQKSLAFLRNRTYLILSAMMFFYLCAEYAINGWLVTYLQSKPQLLAQFTATGTDA
ncbi:MAG: MFS transporter [Eubacteriales bacterium]|nr:MFS transporter [Eubacteriales bacterium]